MSIASKQEALAAVDKARTKAQNAAVRLDETRPIPGDPAGSTSRIDFDAAQEHYGRAIRELEAAINAAAEFEDGAE